MVGTGGCGSHLGLPGKVCSWKSSTGDGQRQAALCPRSAGPPAWTRLQPCVYLLAVIPVLGAPELGELLGGGHLGRLGASGETVQDLGSCRSVGEQHGLPGALPGLGGGVQEGWTAGVAVSTPAVLVQIRIKSTNGSDARVRVRQINIAPAPSRSRAEKYLAEPASGLPAPGMQHPGRAACPLSTGSGGKKSHRPFSFKLCLPALGLPLAGGAGRAVPRAAQGAEEKGESFRLVT